ncbi:MAG: hypothetical protein AVDCRST_MAG96-1839 [uncultured Segetibacter sp.]|uniref:Uncharacterized protein n=1 Tax=uncultured Segetibacter sp. TaxID=481133 RepID=A0A6J4SMT7_9BACT|nr:MAG: hypothetical protein AVDCRST_MAG96-1839 [uncultured Segetibacter sp.]
MQCDTLFVDDTPDHVIDPRGLFNCSYVFEQFSFTKPRFLPGRSPDFPGWHELATDPRQDFATLANDWEFTGGMFPRLADIELE